MKYMKDTSGGPVSEMTVRDHFAGLAMQAMCTGGFQPGQNVTGEEIDWSLNGYAKKAYAIADAMLNAREA